jgi:long-chain fatty acid transport protein
MNKMRLKALVGGGLISLAVIGVAQAGGFSRGTADTDLLYEDGNFNTRFDARVVVPTQKFSANVNPALVGTNFYGTYIIPSASIKFNLTDNFRCAGTYTQNVGADVEYAAPKFPSGKLSEDFHTDEFGATCAVRFAVGEGGVLSVIGGGFVEELTYDRATSLALLGFPPGVNADLELGGQEYGWRAGVAYEIPEIKLRAQLLYRSGTEYGATGSLTAPGALIKLPAVASVTLPATASGNLPQSLDLTVRSGVAPGWLVFGAVRWTDWSVLQTLTVTTPLSTTIDQYQWRDGWTLTGGVVHSFSEAFAGQMSLTWDRGVTTGWDLRDEVWTLALGGRLRSKIGGEFRFGLGLSYLAAAQETQYANAIVPGNIHSGFNQAADSGFATTMNVGFITQW